MTLIDIDKYLVFKLRIKVMVLTCLQAVSIKNFTSSFTVLLICIIPCPTKEGLKEGKCE